MSHRAELIRLLGEHVALVGAALSVSIAAGVPLGILAAHRPRLGAPLIGLANVVQTIPSLAMFGFLIPLPLVGGVGARAAVVALILYGLLPVIRTTAAGLASLDRAIVEAGVAMGMTPGQLLRQVELPLALPAIVAGIRVATVIGIGTATIAAAIGAGGLGEYIFRGLSMVDTTVILAGAVPTAALALTADGLLGLLERRLARRLVARRSGALVAASIAAFGAIALGGALVAATSARAAIVVGSKNFTEQLILGEIVAQAIERGAGLTVERRLNLGGTFICDRALRAGDIDVYVEYTGTALTAIFHEPISQDPREVFDRVRERYARVGLTLTSPLGFNNTYAILVRGADARRLGLRTLSEAAAHTPRWRAGFGYEFLERADGFPGLARMYNLSFAGPSRIMDLSLSYRALADGQVDLIAGDATSGLINALDLTMLEDDRRYFPPYDAAAVVRAGTLLAHPEVRRALDRLAGRIRPDDMRAMNLAVDSRREEPEQVARHFLDSLLKQAPAAVPSGSLEPRAGGAPRSEKRSSEAPRAGVGPRAQ